LSAINQLSDIFCAKPDNLIDLPRQRARSPTAALAEVPRAL